MSVDPVLAIQTRELTETVNREERPRLALVNMLFPESTHRTLMTEYAQVDEKTGDIQMAPIIEVNGEAVAIDVGNGGSYMLQCPMLSVKRPLTAQEILQQRRAGQAVVFSPSGRDIAGENAVMQIAEDVAWMEKSIDKREEWLVSQALTGTITYSVEGVGAITVDMRKPAGNTFNAPNGLWTAGSPKVRSDIKYIKRLANANEVTAPTDAVGDSTAADALDNLIEAGTVILDDSGSTFNPSVDLIAEYQENGLRYIGTIGGIRHWEYSASYKADGTGTVTSFIRPGYFEYLSLSNTAVSNRRMFYGRIPDIKAMREGLDVTKRFAKTIEKEEPSVLISILKSRPLPWFLRADEFFSMKVTA